MEKKLKKEALQSRREFFKKVTKSVLPILGAVVLTSSPLSSEAAKARMGCGNGDCYRGCGGVCSWGCEKNCQNRCDRDACKGTCRGTCQGWCTAAAKGRM